MTIELKKLTKRFGALTAVDSVDLTVGDGEVLCLLGPSGCGKTTTLRHSYAAYKLSKNKNVDGL